MANEPWNWSMVYSGVYGGEYHRFRVIENRYPGSFVIKVVDMYDGGDNGPVVAEFECVDESSCRNAFHDWLRSYRGNV